MTTAAVMRLSLVSQLRDDIVRGVFAPGERLTLAHLAERYEVSMMPVREALNALQAEGIVTILPRRGAVVTRFTPAEILEIYTIRATLERLATQNAAPKLGASALSQLRRLVNQMEGLGHDWARFSALNMDFHTTIYQAAGQVHLLAMIVSLRHRTHHYLRVHTEASGDAAAVSAGHRRLLRLLQEGQTEAAAAEMYQHVYEVGVNIARLIGGPDKPAQGASPAP
ncbi:GntR family transcriptional regulator [Deinococcus sp.]|uniref:GntR family transcriptional regulator n=1 Tax=Deinococcus sp. TaxID=47478 RepID=UPI0025E43801|nr:GntR family transcriptional regulator [Deinococcus sp.]